ncbi:MAG: methylmalonyl-CoA mutase family protein [Thermotogae bacterium]|nr:methylmalonyl-CoA mutase family protein [Thermotogota bacterium]
MFDISKLDDLKKKKENWDMKTRSFMEKHPERMKDFKTPSGTPVKRVYTPVDIEDLEYDKSIGFPGEYPYTRGIYPTMYRGRLWTMRQYAGFGSAEETNRRYKYLLEQGQTGLSVAFDLPTQIGYDSDAPLSVGEVGKVGVAIDSLRDMEVLFGDIPLDKVSTSMTINSTAMILLAMYIAVAEKQGIDRKVLRGTIQNDILKEYIARGTYIYPPKTSMRLTTDILEYTATNLPMWKPISISGYHMREAGATAAQELAFTIADGIEYVKHAVSRKLDVNILGKQISFFFAAHNDVFEEIAKFRAARRLWAKIMKNEFNASNPDAWKLRFHTQTGGSTLTAQQPNNNIIRVAYQALAAVLGGTQSLHTNSRDEALSLPTEESVMIALRTQQILAYETGVANTADPLAGSYYVESLTDEMEKQAKKYIDKVKEMGGMLNAIEEGYVQREIHESAYKYQKEWESGKRVIVGVNKYTMGEEKQKLGIMRVDPDVERKQIEKLKKLKKERDNGSIKKDLDEIKRAAETDENLMPFVLKAVHDYATVGEISNALREVFGEYREVIEI